MLLVDVGRLLMHGHTLLTVASVCHYVLNNVSLLWCWWLQVGSGAEVDGVVADLPSNKEPADVDVTDNKAPPPSSTSTKDDIMQRIARGGGVMVSVFVCDCKLLLWAMTSAVIDRHTQNMMLAVCHLHRLILVAFLVTSDVTWYLLCSISDCLSTAVTCSVASLTLSTLLMLCQVLIWVTECACVIYCINFKHR